MIQNLISTILIQNSISSNLFQVDFDEFKEIFVKLLTMDSYAMEEGGESHNAMDEGGESHKAVEEGESHNAVEEGGESQDVALVREYLRNTWTKLGLPENGHLTLEDLGLVCTDIGMGDVSEEAIQQLFVTLDRDGDGKVSFEELLLGMSSQQELLTCKTESKVNPSSTLARREEEGEEEEEENGRKEEEGTRNDRNFETSPNFLISLYDPNKDG